MKTKAKKAPTPQLDLEATSTLSEPKPVKEAEPAKAEAKTFRSAALGTGRRSLFRDLREGEVG